MECQIQKYDADVRLSPTASIVYVYKKLRSHGGKPQIRITHSLHQKTTMADLEKRDSNTLGLETSKQYGVAESIPYIDPVQEKRVLRKFDKWLLP